jgi:hypothetical protein
MRTHASPTLDAPYRLLANLTEFEKFLSGNGALYDRMLNKTSLSAA